MTSEDLRYPSIYVPYSYAIDESFEDLVLILCMEKEI